MGEIQQSAASESQLYAAPNVSALGEGKKLDCRATAPELMIERRSSNRGRMPTVAAIVDEYRASFPELKVIFASENGVTVGKRPTNEKAFTIPRNYRKPGGGWPK